MALLNHARKLESWPKLALYLISADLISQALYIEDSSIGGTNQEFKKFLQCYCAFDEDDASRIYGLRCSLLHQFGLSNLPPKSRRKEGFVFYRFRLNGDPKSQPITKALKPWDGDFQDDITEDEKTTIGLDALCERIEAGVQKCEAEVKNGEITFPMPEDHFRRRFLFHQPSHKTRSI